MNEDILNGKIEPWDSENDVSDLIMSYSKLNVYENCPMRYDYYYNQQLKGINDKTLALQLGTLCHKVLEEKALMVMNGELDYDKLTRIFYEGATGSNVDDDDEVIGIADLKLKYGFEEWFSNDSEGNNYQKKSDLFIKSVVPHEANDNNGNDCIWMPMAAEERFDFVYNLKFNGEVKKIHFLGYIDRIDVRISEDGEQEFRVVDYKTSKKAYDSKATTTALQMIIYGFYIYLKYGKLPSEYLYSFVLLDDRKKANTLGYLKRGIKKIDKLLTEIFANEVSGEWKEKATPLCYYCPYRSDSMLKDPIVGDTCRKYCLWTPDNKVFAKFGDDPFKSNTSPSAANNRKLMF